jgi:hypothetical protein
VSAKGWTGEDGDEQSIVIKDRSLLDVVETHLLDLPTICASRSFSSSFLCGELTWREDGPGRISRKLEAL